MKIAERINQFVMAGNPGAKFKKNFDKMLSKLELPNHVKEQFDNSAKQIIDEGPEVEDSKGEDKEEVKQNAEITDYTSLFKGGRYHLIPSFFVLIEKLKSEGRDFAIVFRSFGNDLKAVIAEFNA